MKLLAFSLAGLLLTGCVTRDDPPESVIVSRLVRVIDGDTFVCDIDRYPDIIGKSISIRLRGIDTPELRSKDPEERKSANLEKQRLSDLLHNARVIELRNLGRDKYFRIDADVRIDGEPLLPQLNRDYFLPRGRGGK